MTGSVRLFGNIRLSGGPEVRKPKSTRPHSVPVVFHHWRWGSPESRETRYAAGKRLIGCSHRGQSVDAANPKDRAAIAAIINASATTRDFEFTVFEFIAV